mmetsp:Transcript_50396/g.96264  ORF Transcript_50396/g.96264 Transcript_50396/m.96264 type:complete len:267 (-) Transcript_50396:76-876(-)
MNVHVLLRHDQDVPCVVAPLSFLLVRVVADGLERGQHHLAPQAVVRVSGKVRRRRSHRAVPREARAHVPAPAADGQPAGRLGFRRPALGVGLWGAVVLLHRRDLGRGGGGLDARMQRRVTEVEGGGDAGVRAAAFCVAIRGGGHQLGLGLDLRRPLVGTGVGRVAMRSDVAAGGGPALAGQHLVGAAHFLGRGGLGQTHIENVGHRAPGPLVTAVQERGLLILLMDFVEAARELELGPVAARSALASATQGRRRRARRSASLQTRG